MNKHVFTVLKPFDFLADVEQESGRAKKRVWIQSMYLRPGQVAGRIEVLLRRAEEKKLDTRLHVDWYALMVGKNKAERKTLYARLQENGAKLMFTNPPDFIGRLWPYKGRNHMKMTIVDDISYVGGANLGDSDFEYIDFMVKITDPKITDAVAQQFVKVEDQSFTTDEEILLDDENKLLVDVGVREESVILQKAVEAVDNAEESVVHTSQFIPDGEFLQALSGAYERGVAVDVTVPLRNDFDPALALVNRVNNLLMRVKKAVIPLHVYPTMVHAKLLIVDGKRVFFGSHNLSQRGVQMGTAEIMIESINEQLISQFEELYKNLK